MDNNRLRALLVLMINISVTTSFSISDQRDVGDLQNPARTDEGASSINLQCNLQFNPGEKWSTCKWTKIFDDIPADWTDSSSQYAFVMCSTTSLHDDGEVCEDQGNLNNEFWASPAQNPHTQYDTRRLQYSVRENTCGLTINNPHANDTGNWICQVTDNSPNTEPVTMRGSVRVFTAQKSVINVTRPNMRTNPTYSIYADFGNRINYDLETLECTASGIPTPQIFWYIDDPRNRIEASAYSQREVFNSDFDVEVVSTLSRLTLDRNSLSRYGIRTADSNFGFAVGCYAEQNGYFDTDQDIRHPAEVLVFGNSGAASVSGYVGALVLLSILQYL